MTSKIEIRDLRLSYGPKEVIHGISLDILPNEIFGVIDRTEIPRLTPGAPACGPELPSVMPRIARVASTSVHATTPAPGAPNVAQHVERRPVTALP